MRPALWTLVIIASVCAGSAGQTQPSGRLIGTVVAADDGSPVFLADVHVTVNPPVGVMTMRSTAYTTQTNRAGQFEFPSLAPATYPVSVDVRARFERIAKPTSVTIVAGQTSEVTFRLTRTGVIAGRVVNQAGEAIRHAQVRALRIDPLGEPTEASSGATDTTDDLGQYRLFNLSSGDYVVLATPKAPAGYARTFHPATSSAQNARVVRVAAGKDTAGIDVSLAPARLSGLTVNIVDSEGRKLPRQAYVSLTPLDAFDSSQIPAKAIEEGVFVFPDVLPGRHSLIASPTISRADAAYVKVTADGNDRVIDVATNRGATVSGRVILQGTPRARDARGWTPRISIGASRTQFGVNYFEGSRVELPQDGGRFELRGLRGPVRLEPSLTAGALVSMQRGSEDIIDGIIELTGTEAVDDVVIVMTTDVGAIDVSLAGDFPDGVETVSLVVYPQDERRRPRGAYVRDQDAAAPAVRSAVALDFLLPGRYHVALVRGRITGRIGPVGFKQLRPSATIEVSARQRAAVTVSLSDLPR